VTLKPVPPFIAQSKIQARETFLLSTSDLKIFYRPFSQTGSPYQRTHYRQVRYSLEPYPAPSWTIRRSCAWFEYPILNLGTIFDFTANPELMILAASLSSTLKLHTSVPQFLDFVGRACTLFILEGGESIHAFHAQTFLT
jgi:hypothetical protein